MVKTTPTELISKAEQLVNEHHCPYAEELLKSEEILAAQRNQQLGATARILSKIDTLLLDLTIIHNHEQCPPTYQGHRMTHEWMVWSGEVASAETMVRAAMSSRATNALAA